MKKPKLTVARRVAGAVAACALTAAMGAALVGLLFQCQEY